MKKLITIVKPKIVAFLLINIIVMNLSYSQEKNDIKKH